MTKMKILCSLGLLALLAAPALSWAQAPRPAATPQQQAKYETSTGVVESFTHQSLVISDGADQQMTFRVESDTKMPESTLQKGQNVRVDWKRGNGGERIAIAVNIVNKPTELL